VSFQFWELRASMSLARLWRDQGDSAAYLRSNSGNFAILDAIRRASSRVSSLATDLRPGSFS
jgi:hypothetical protein